MATITADAFICGGQVAGLIAARTIAEKGYTVYVQEWTNELGGMCVAGVLQVDYSSRPPAGRANKFWLDVKEYAESQGAVWDGTNAPAGLHPANGLPRNVSPLWVLYVINTTLTNHPNITVVKSVDITGVDKDATTKRVKSVSLSNGDTVVCKQWTDYSYESWLASHDDVGIPHEYGRIDRLQWDEENSGNAVFAVTDNLKVDFPIRRTNGNLHRQRTHRPSLPDGYGSLTTMGFNWRFMMSTKANRRPWSTLEAPLLALGWRMEDYTDFISELLQRNATNIGHIASSHPCDTRPEADALHTTNPTNLNEILLARKYPLLRTPNQARWFKDQMFLATAGKIFAAYSSPETSAQLKTNLAKYALPGDVYQTNYWRVPGWPPQPYIRSCRRARGIYTATWNNFQTVPPDPACHAGYNADSHQHFWFWDPETAISWKEGGPEPHQTSTWLVPWRFFKPHKQHCTNGLLGWNGAESYIMSTDLRIETIKMMQGEVAGIAMALALDLGIDVVDVTYDALKPRLLAAGFNLSL